jgi:hypothetical protein
LIVVAVAFIKRVVVVVLAAPSVLPAREALLVNVGLAGEYVVVITSR